MKIQTASWRLSRTSLIRFCIFVALAVFVGCASKEPIAPPPAPAATQPTIHGELSDTLDIAVTGNPEAHAVVADGVVQTVVHGERVGAHDMRRKCHVVRGPRASVSYRISVTPNQPMTLEIE